MGLSEADRERLRALEERLLRPEVRRTPALLDELLADDFLEFGASGRRYDKAQIMAALGSESGKREYEIRDFRAIALGDGLALVTYRGRSTMAGEPTRGYLRSSIWRLADGSWRILFHQGTPVPAGVAEPAAG